MQTDRIALLTGTLASWAISASAVGQTALMPYSTESGASVIEPALSSSLEPVFYNGKVYRGGRDPSDTRWVVNVYDAESGVYERSISPPDGIIQSNSSLAQSVLADTGEIVCSYYPYGSAGVSLLVFDADSGELLRRIYHHPDAAGLTLWDELVASDSYLAYSGTVSIDSVPFTYIWKHVNVCDRQTGEFQFRIDHDDLDDPASQFRVMSISDEYVAVGITDTDIPTGGEVRVYEISSGALVAAHTNPGDLRHFGLYADLIGDSLYVRAHDDEHVIYRYQPPTATTPDIIQLPGGPAQDYGTYVSRTVAFGDYLAVGRSGGTGRFGSVVVVDPRNSQSVRLLRLEGDPFSRFCDEIAVSQNRLYARSDVGPGPNAFRYFDLDEICFADIGMPYGEVNLFDIGTFLGFYTANDPKADLAAPYGSLNFFDVSAYVSGFTSCGP